MLSIHHSMIKSQSCIFKKGTIKISEAFAITTRLDVYDQKFDAQKIRKIRAVSAKNDLNSTLRKSE